MKNMDGLTDDEFEEALWKSQVMFIRAKKQGRGGVSALPFWGDMISFSRGRTLRRNQLEHIRKAHKERDSK